MAGGTLLASAVGHPELPGIGLRGYDLDGDARFYHRWAIVRDQRPLSTWQVADPVARWDDVPLLWRGNFGIDTWLSLREQPARTHVDGEIGAREPYAGNPISNQDRRGRQVEPVEHARGQEI